jgi:hypothetical protein
MESISAARGAPKERGASVEAERWNTPMMRPAWREMKRVYRGYDSLVG